ncbi:hypothetical protein AB0I28_16590 [Phytomonospora sp. NPDC050363]
MGTTRLVQGACAGKANLLPEKVDKGRFRLRLAVPSQHFQFISG